MGHVSWIASLTKIYDESVELGKKRTTIRYQACLSCCRLLSRACCSCIVQASTLLMSALKGELMADPCMLPMHGIGFFIPRVSNKEGAGGHVHHSGHAVGRARKGGLGVGEGGCRAEYGEREAEEEDKCSPPPSLSLSAQNLSVWFKPRAGCRC